MELDARFAAFALLSALLIVTPGPERLTGAVLIALGARLAFERR